MNKRNIYIYIYIQGFPTYMQEWLDQLAIISQINTFLENILGMFRHLLDTFKGAWGVLGQYKNES